MPSIAPDTSSFGALPLAMTCWLDRLVGRRIVDDQHEFALGVRHAARAGLSAQGSGSSDAGPHHPCLPCDRGWLMKKRCGEANVPVRLHEAARCANIRPGLTGLKAAPGLPACRDLLSRLAIRKTGWGVACS
jgi:hypothetical protein